VLVAVLTFRRTQLLPDLLAALVHQARTISPSATVLVVDNDPDGSARESVQGWAAEGVRYAHEPRPGISAARNRALTEAADADALVFIDDDELPSPEWLRSLVSAWQRWGCAAVTGPVVARFSGPVDAWVAGSGVFEPFRASTGDLLRGAGAGNLLLDMTVVRALGLSFDERTGLTGGEDTMFTRSLLRAGRTIRWAEDALATETVPAERTTRAWVLRRVFRSASSWCRAELTLETTALGRWRRRAALTLRAGVRVAQATVALLWAGVRGDVARNARATCALAAQAGVLAGLFGYVRTEYSRPV
jgi:cellulose synthase/poly-beta-1,6-N-acetylglucosamine synthase-like glycosyltransferase